jgi:transcriptional regulator with XRE-family HTH domain
MTELGGRISAVISALDLKKVEFAARLKIDQSYVTQIINGRRNPSDRLLSDICREFGVDELWLRSGIGEMFRPRSRNEELAAFFGDVLSGDEDFRQRFITVLSRMTTQEWTMLERKMWELVELTRESEQGKEGEADV